MHYQFMNFYKEKYNKEVNFIKPNEVMSARDYCIALIDQMHDKLEKHA